MTYTATDEIDYCVGKKIREIRIMAKMTQENLGDLIGVSLQQIQKYESAANRISASRLYKVARVFNISINDFFENCPKFEVEYQSNFGQIPQNEEQKLIIERKKQEFNLIMAFNAVDNNQIREHLIMLIKSISKI